MRSPSRQRLIAGLCLVLWVYVPDTEALMGLKRVSDGGDLILDGLKGAPHREPSVKQLYSELMAVRTANNATNQTSDASLVDEYESNYEAAERASSDSVASGGDDDLYYIDHKGRRRKKGIGSMTRRQYHKLIRTSRWFNPEITQEYQLDWWFKNIEFDEHNSNELLHLMEERRVRNLQREDNIFFIRTGTSERDLKPRVWCSIESAATAAAAAGVNGAYSYLHVNLVGGLHECFDVYAVSIYAHDAFNPQGGSRRLLDALGNVHIEKLDLESYLEKTPFGRTDWYLRLLDRINNRGARKEPNLLNNLSNAFRLAVLYLKGGTYLDTDVLLLRDDTNLLPNFLGRQREPESPAPYVYHLSLDRLPSGTAMLNNAVMKFSKRHPFIGLVMANFVSNYRGEKWGHNGPHCVSRSLDCATWKMAHPLWLEEGSRFDLGCPSTRWDMKHNLEVHKRSAKDLPFVLWQDAFFPVRWTKAKDLFKSPSSATGLETLRLLRHPDFLSREALNATEDNTISPRAGVRHPRKVGLAPFGVHLWGSEIKMLNVSNDTVIGKMMQWRCPKVYRWSEREGLEL